MNIKVPKGMRERAERDGLNGSREFDLGFLAGMDFACHDISEHPIVPTDEQAKELWRTSGAASEPNEARRASIYAVEWQRRMFHEDVPEEIRDMLDPYGEVFQLVVEIDGMSDPGVPSSTGDQAEMRDRIFKFIIEAFRRGQQSNAGNSK